MEFFGFFERPFHALGARSQNDFCAVSGNESPALHAHGIGHYANGTIPFGGGNGRQGNARVAACRFDNDRARFQKSARFGIFNHRKGGTVFGRARGVKVFEFGNDLGCKVKLLFPTRQAQKGSVSDQFRDFLCDFHFLILSFEIKKWDTCDEKSLKKRPRKTHVPEAFFNVQPALPNRYERPRKCWETRRKVTTQAEDFVASDILFHCPLCVFHSTILSFSSKRLFARLQRV